jgi:hypothetical protein
MGHYSMPQSRPAQPFSDQLVAKISTSDDESVMKARWAETRGFGGRSALIPARMEELLVWPDATPRSSPNSHREICECDFTDTPPVSVIS